MNKFACYLVYNKDIQMKELRWFDNEFLLNQFYDSTTYGNIELIKRVPEKDIEIEE